MTTVTGNLQDLLGQPASGFHVVFDLTRTDYESGKITVRGSESVSADQSGEFSIELEPNEGKTQSSQYTVKVYEPTGTRRQVWSTTITVPDAATVDITAIIDEPPYPSVDAAQQALQAVQAASAQALIDIGDAETDAVTAITDAWDAGVTAIEDARDQGVGAIEQARDAAINALNGLVQQAEDARDASQDARDLSQAWAEGTEPGGEGTKSSREHAEDSAQSASDAEGFKDDAETAAATLPDFTGQPAGLAVVSDGDDGSELVERFGPEDLAAPGPHNQSFVANLIMPPLGSGNFHAPLYGRPDAPATGQTPGAQVGGMQWVYPWTIQGGFTGRTLEIRGRYFLFGGASAAYFLGFIVDADNWYQLGWSRSRYQVIQSVDGVVSELEDSTALGGVERSDTMDYWVYRNGRNTANRGGVMMSQAWPYSYKLPDLPFDLDESTAVGFGHSTTSAIEQYAYVAIMGTDATVVGSAS